MNFKHFDDVKPNDKAQFEMLYFSAQRALRRLELKLNRIYDGQPPKHLRIELKQLNRKLTQMAGVWKLTNHAKPLMLMTILTCCNIRMTIMT